MTRNSETAERARDVLRELVAERERFDAALAEARAMRELLATIRDGFDCDEDAHRYGTMCRKCAAREALKGGGSDAA